MANIKLYGNTWDTSGIYDNAQGKTQKEVNADVSELKTAIGNIEFVNYSKNRWNGGYVTGKYVNESTGNLTTASNHCSSDYIDISNAENNTVIISKRNPDGNFSNLRYFFYDAEKTPISGSGGINPTLNTNSDLGRDYCTLTIPTNAVFMRFSNTITNFTDTNREFMVSYEVSAYSAYTGDYHTIATDRLIDNPLVFTNSPTQVRKATFSDGEMIIAEKNSIMKNQYIAFTAKIDGTFGNVVVGHGTGSYGYYIKVDGTNMTYGSNDSWGTAIAHGLTIEEFIGVIIEVDVELNVKTTITTKEGYYTHSQQINSSWRGDVFATSNSTTFKDAVLTWYSKDYKNKVWAFGDSYFTLYASTRWTYYIANKWGFNTVLLNAYPGENSSAAYNDFVAALKHGIPKYVLWCLGMNDPDESSAINETWLEKVQAVKEICDAYGITLILQTLPNVTNASYKNTYKNAWILQSGIRYVDMATALSDVDDWLSDDGVHPSAVGGRFMALKMLADVPELVQDK